MHLIRRQVAQLIPVVDPRRLALADDRLNRRGALAPQLHAQSVTFALFQGKTMLVNPQIPQIGRRLPKVETEFTLRVIGQALAPNRPTGGALTEIAIDQQIGVARLGVAVGVGGVVLPKLRL